MTEKKEAKKKKTTSKKSGISKHDKAIIDKLTTNFVSLQRVMTDVAVKMNDLTENVTKLLQIFELSAKNFAEKYSAREDNSAKNEEINRELADKINNLLDQNKTIAKGIMLMEEKLRTKNPIEQLRERNNAYQGPPPQQSYQFNNPNSRPRPYPRSEWD